MDKIQEIYPPHPAERYLSNKRREPVIQKLVRLGLARKAHRQAQADLAPPAKGPATAETKGPFNHGEDEGGEE